MSTPIAVNGAAGRMGRAVIETASDRDDLDVVVGVDVAETDAIEGVPIVEPAAVADAVDEYGPRVVVDFTRPDATIELAATCERAGVGMVVGTTGFDADQRATLRTVSESVPVLKATNFSRGIQVLLRAVRTAVGALDGYDLELLETHHNGKVDAPSGTAGTILETIRAERDVEPVYGREGHAPRDADEIGVFARRAGDIRGEHELVLAGNDEVVTLAHRAEDRAVFAAGALDAAAWLAGRDPGWYEFDSVIDEA